MGIPGTRNIKHNLCQKRRKLSLYLPWVFSCIWWDFRKRKGGAQFLVMQVECFSYDATCSSFIGGIYRIFCFLASVDEEGKKGSARP